MCVKILTFRKIKRTRFLLRQRHARKNILFDTALQRLLTVARLCLLTQIFGYAEKHLHKETMFTCVFGRVQMHVCVNACKCVSMNTQLSMHVPVHCVDSQTCPYVRSPQKKRWLSL